MPTLKLMYFSGRGRAEVARLILAYTDTPYEDVRYEKEQWPAVKPTTPFGQVPALQVDGEIICQSMAIYRYLGKITGIAGTTELEQAKVDMVADCCEDIVKPLIDIFLDKSETGKVMKRESYISQQLPAVLSKLEILLKSNKGGKGYFVGDKVMKRESYISQQLPAVLSKLEILLKSNKGGKGYFVGDKLTWADIKFYHDVTAPKTMGINVRIDDKYPKLAALRDRVEANENIARWLETRPKTAN